MRYKFEDIFGVADNGTLRPRRYLSVNGSTVGPGISFHKGVNVGGINLHQWSDCDVEAREEDGVLMLQGFYD